MKRAQGDGTVHVPKELGPNENLSMKEVVLYASGLVILIIALGMGIVWALVRYFE